MEQKQLFPLLTILLLLVSGILFVAYYKEKTSTEPQEIVLVVGEQGGVNVSQVKSEIYNLPKENLTNKEVEAILYMREEEKLARDVYETLYEKFQSNVFQNIAKSEQTHMDTVLILIEKYGLSDPVGNDTRGVFQNTTLQNLYNELVANGSKSLEAAYTVGAIIEEVDIIDLDNYLGITDQEDIQIAFELLRAGSENHLRAFTRQLSNLGVTYSPHYLSQEEYDAIISGTNQGSPKNGVTITTTTDSSSSGSYETLYISGGIIFSLAGIGIGAYYWYGVRKKP